MIQRRWAGAVTFWGILFVVAVGFAYLILQALGSAK